MTEPQKEYKAQCRNCPYKGHCILMTEPHPLRCETCAYKKLVGRVPDIQDCEKMDHTPTMSDLKLIARVGCASHSNATPASRVLEDIEQRAKRQLHKFTTNGLSPKERGENNILNWIIGVCKDLRNQEREQ